MGRRIAFAVLEIILPRKTALEKLADIMPDGRIGILVDGHPGRGMGSENQQDAFTAFGSPHKITDLLRDIDELNALAGLDLDGPE